MVRGACVYANSSPVTDTRISPMVRTTYGSTCQTTEIFTPAATGTLSRPAITKDVAPNAIPMGMRRSGVSSQPSRLKNG